MMPIYSYECGKCGNQVELVQGINDDSPSCCDMAMTKLLTAPAIIRMKGEVPAMTSKYKSDYSKDYLRSIGKA